jgi:hypothetical protein
VVATFRSKIVPPAQTMHQRIPERCADQLSINRQAEGQRAARAGDLDA